MERLVAENEQTTDEKDELKAGIAALGSLSAKHLRNAALAATALSLAATVVASAMHSPGDTGSGLGGGASLNPFAERYNETDKLYVPADGTDAGALRQRSEGQLKAQFDDVEEGLWDRWDHDGPKGLVMDQPMNPEIKKAVAEVAVIDPARGFGEKAFGNPYPHGSGVTPGGDGTINSSRGFGQGEKRAAGPRGGDPNGRGVGSRGPRVGSGGGGGGAGGGPVVRTPGGNPGGTGTGGGNVPIGVIIGTLPDLVMPIIRDGDGGGALPTTPFVQLPDENPLSKDDRYAISDDLNEVPIPAPALLFPAGLALLQWKRRRAQAAH